MRAFRGASVAFDRKFFLEQSVFSVRPFVGSEIVFLSLTRHGTTRMEFKSRRPVTSPFLLRSSRVSRFIVEKLVGSVNSARPIFLSFRSALLLMTVAVATFPGEGRNFRN